MESQRVVASVPSYSTFGSRIKITSAQIIKRVQAMRMDKTQRIAKTAPAEIRRTVREELERIQ